MNEHQPEPLQSPRRRSYSLSDMLAGMRALDHHIEEMQKYSRAAEWYAREVLIRERDLETAPDIDSAQAAMTSAWESNRIVAVSMCKAVRQAANVWEYNDTNICWGEAVDAVEDAAQWARIAQRAIERMEERNSREWDDWLVAR